MGEVPCRFVVSADSSYLGWLPQPGFRSGDTAVESRPSGLQRGGRKTGTAGHSQLTLPQGFPVMSSGALVSKYPFVRTGLLGFIGPGGLFFVVGKIDGLMMVSELRHNAYDIVATALAMESMKFAYRGR